MGSHFTFYHLYMNYLLVAALFCIAFCTDVSAADSDQPIDFARQVLPILSNKCFVCHGPDVHDDTDLRLDSVEEATRDLGGYQAIDPDDPGKSELSARIDSEDEPMPPSDAEKQLTDGERDLIRRWVAQGGQYAKHWAFVAPIKADSFDSASLAIDRYVERQLKEKNIDFAPEAARSTLARRVALVLTGLPLESDQLDQYLADDTPQAYERLVDRLLDDPRFGEHQARYWLDAVRYGDTHGLHLDNRRGIFPYRDWVVRAFNTNLPFDKFVEWQLAGDLLPDATLEQQVATGYVRLNPSTGEGGAISAEFQVKNNFDRVETLGTVFLGMSLTCARCHTHKYDPIEQTEYYQLLAFFNSTAEPALDGNSYTYGPVVKVPPDQNAWRHWQELQTTSRKLIHSIESKFGDFSSVIQFAEDRSNWSTSNWRISKPIVKTEPKLPKTDSEEADWVAAKGLPGILDKKLARKRHPDDEHLVWVSFDLKVAREQSLDLTFTGSPGSHVLVDSRNVPVLQSDRSGFVTDGAIHFSPGNHTVQIAIQGNEKLPKIEIRIANRWDTLATKKEWAGLTPVERLRLISDQLGPLAGPWSNEAAELAESFQQAESEFTTSLIARELPEARETRFLRRGEYDQPVGEPLDRGVLAVMSPFPEGAPRNRLGLAKWLTSPNHPLVSRVLVNRLWQQILGEALVRTPEDFGLQGEQATHPQLLDWLAVEFQESQWNMKRLLRSMVISRTFRQSSAWRRDVDDPENRLYARASSYRMDAEVLRDIGLWSSELLDPTMGGEGVKPYQPDGMWKALAHPASNTKQYKRDSGKRLYRRSLYVYWKRTSPHPMMTLFDAPDRESSCVRRSRTNTPLQSLGMLNETQRIEMGREFAERLIRLSDDNDVRIDSMFRLLAHRLPSEVQRKSCSDLLDKARKTYAESPSDAELLLSVGESNRDLTIDAVEHAAWTQLTTMILASDVAILLY